MSSASSAKSIDIIAGNATYLVHKPNFFSFVRFLHDCFQLKLQTAWSGRPSFSSLLLFLRDVCSVLVSSVRPGHWRRSRSVWFFNAALMFHRYWLPADSSNSLSVHVQRDGEPGDALWRRPGSPSTGWEVAEVTVSSPARFYVRLLLKKTYL